MFNESAVCALGRDLARSDRLSAAAVETAVHAVARFSRLARRMEVGRLSLLATAAVRDAANGRDFADRVREACGERVDILSGEDEARISALGVMWGMPGAKGVVGDLGGGSLELVEVGGGNVLRQATLPLGILRLSDLYRRRRAEALERIGEAFAGVDWLRGAARRSFYPVGGAWRAVARLHMARTGHPLRMIDGHSVPAREMDDIARLAAARGLRSLRRVRGLSERRRANLPLAAELMRAALAATGARRVTFSAQGLREGFLYTQISDRERGADPALAAAVELAAREARFRATGEALFDWTEPLFQGGRAARRRLRRIACHLADVGWREHPDYRAVQAFERVLRFPFAGLRHRDRAFLAYAVFVRYGGDPQAPELRAAFDLLPPGGRRRADVLGLAFRLAFGISSGAAETLRRAPLEVAEGRLHLRLPADAPDPPADRTERQLAALAAACGLECGGVFS